tara:strand:- start:222 stop:2627 length:2406 start_codon:yes stop_codon:yes gene_type:complete
MQLNLKFKILSSLVLILVLSFLFYIFSNQQPFQTLYDNGFDGLLNFIIKSETPERIKFLVKDLDVYYWNIIAAALFLISIIIIIFNSKKVLFLRKFYDLTKFEEYKKSKDKNLYYLIALAACLCLFHELAMIRIHSSYFQIFAYFKNLSLISCFLGLGIGYSLSKRKIFSLGWVMPITTLQILFMYLLKDTPITLFFQNPVSEQWNIGQSVARGFFHIGIIYAFIIIVFLINAICFVPLGHLVARLMYKTNPLQAYSYDLLGSIIGVIIFSLLSFLWTGPLIWLTFSFVILSLFLIKNKRDFLATIFSFFILTFFLSVFEKTDTEDYHSPYQNVTVQYSNDNHAPMQVKSNNIWLQVPLNLSEDHFIKKSKSWHELYSLPHKIKNFESKETLIVGSGVGNDVAATLRNSSAKIDAVEIDPLVADLGIKFHPEKPYLNERVKLTINDARNFIKETKKKYDLIIYSVLDSHANLSGKGGVRLDSYVYTVESFFEAKQKLNKDGIIFLSFAVSTKEMGIKIYKMLSQSFNSNPPLVLTRKDPNKFVDNIYVFVVSDNQLDLDLINTSFKNTNLFLPGSSIKNVDMSTDDWPFFYMSYRVYPLSYMLLISLIFIVSFVFIKKHTGINLSKFSFTSFFLGVGFMLMETKGITELAKIYGSTWVVVSIVIVSVLSMAYIANLLIIKNIKISNNQIYFFLLISILISLGITFINYYNYPTYFLKVFVPIILTLPVLFSGLAFSRELIKSGSTANTLSCNILGALVGGLLEYNSMYFGFKFLYLLAFFSYLMAYISFNDFLKNKFTYRV